MRTYRLTQKWLNKKGNINIQFIQKETQVASKQMELTQIHN